MWKSLKQFENGWATDSITKDAKNHKVQKEEALIENRPKSSISMP
jgi:hypothetical protein